MNGRSHLFIERPSATQAKVAGANNALCVMLKHWLHNYRRNPAFSVASLNKWQFLVSLLQPTADYSSYAGYGQSPYANPYSYYTYMPSMATAPLGCGTASATVPSTQTYQLLPPSTTGTSNGTLLASRTSRMVRTFCPVLINPRFLCNVLLMK